MLSAWEGPCCRVLRLADSTTNAGGFEALAMIRKGQVQNVGGNDISVERIFTAGLFQIAA